MHIHLRQSGLLLRNIKIYRICVSCWKKNGNQIIGQTTVPGADGNLKLVLTMFCRLVTASSRRDSTGLLTNSKFDDFVINSKSWVETGRWMSLDRSVPVMKVGAKYDVIWWCLDPQICCWHIFAPFIKQRCQGNILIEFYTPCKVMNLA